MKRLLALTILALGIPTLMGAQVQDTKEVKPLNTVAPTDDDGDLCEKGITDYNGAKVLCSQVDFNNMTSGTITEVKKYVLGNSFSLVNFKPTGAALEYFEFDGRGNTLTMKGEIGPTVWDGIARHSLFVELKNQTTFKNVKLRQQSVFTLTSEASGYNFYSILASDVTSSAGTNLFENIDFETTWNINHTNNSYSGGLFSRARISGSANVIIDNSRVWTKINRTVANNTYSTEWNGGIVGELAVDSTDSNFVVKNSSIIHDHVAINHFKVSVFSGGIAGRYTAKGTKTNFQVDNNYIDFKFIAGRTASDADNNTMISYSGGVIGTTTSSGSKDAITIKDTKLNVNLDSNRGSLNTYKHRSGGLIGSHVANANSLLNIDGVIITGSNKSNAVTEETLGGMIAYKSGQTDSEKFNISNSIVLTDIMATYDQATRTTGKVIGKMENSVLPTTKNLYHLSTMNFTPGPDTYDLGVQISKEEMNYEFFSGQGNTRAIKPIELNVDAWDIMPYSELWNGNTLALQLKWQAWAASPVVNDGTKAPIIDIESFRFPDGDRVSPIIWVVGAVLALLAGAYVWYKKRKSAY